MQQHKVVFVNRYFYPDISATSQLLSDLAFHLAREGIPVHVVASRQGHDRGRPGLPAREVIDRVKVSRVWSSRFGRRTLLGRAIDYLTFCISAGWRLLRLLRRGDIVVANTEPPLISVVGCVAASVKGARLVNWLQDIFPDIARVVRVRGMTGVLVRIFGRLHNVTLAKARINVVVGDAMQRHLADRLGANRARIEVIYNWAHAVRVTPPEENPLRTSWGLRGRFVVGYSGNMGRAHEFDTMLRAAERLREDEKFVFLFIGNGARRGQIEQWAAAKRLSNVILKPYQPREALGNCLGVPDVHLVSLLPTVEGLAGPSKVFGAMAAGRPILFIGDPNGEVAGIVREAKCGMAVPPGDVDGLTTSLERLAQEPELRMEWGRNARTAFEERYQKHIAMKKWSSLLAELRAETVVRV